MISARPQRLLEYSAIAALLFTFFGFFSVKVWDIDFWGHIAAGKMILANGAIPSQDPFGIYDAANNFGQTVLKGQWLGQVLLYSVYRFFGLDGIIFFRAAVLTTCLGIAYWRCRIAGANRLFTLSILALAGLAVLSHTGERPQLFSFLYLSLVFLLLDMHLQTAQRWPLYFIPMAFLLWANSHGGVVFGVAVLGLFCTGYVLENRLATGNYNIPQNRWMLAVLVLSATAFLLAPNGITTLKFIFFPENILIRERMSEYATPWTLWRVTTYYWVFLVITLVSLPGFFGRAYLKQAIVVCVVAAFSLTGYRYIPLFVLLAAPYVAASLSRMLQRVQFPDIKVNLAALVFALIFLAYGFKQERIFQHGVLESRYPGAAVAFIKANHLSGKMFNTLNWGDYLNWNLYPSVTIFIDGRTLDPGRLVPYTHALWMTPYGRHFFEQARFDLVLVSGGNDFTGETYPIINYLLNNSDWQVVYQDRAGYLFTRTKAS